jgi:hypothetical protein
LNEKGGRGSRRSRLIVEEKREISKRKTLATTEHRD